MYRTNHLERLGKRQLICRRLFGSLGFLTIVAMFSALGLPFLIGDDGLTTPTTSGQILCDAGNPETERRE